MEIKLFNPIFNVKINYTFHNIETMLAIKGNEYGCRETIISVTVEDDYLYLQNYLKNIENYNEDFCTSYFKCFLEMSYILSLKKRILKLLDDMIFK